MLSSVVIVSKNNIIGCENGLIFDIKEDLKHFKEITTGKIIILGRKTFESLPFILPNRHHIILTNNTNYEVPKSKEKIEIVHNINDIIKKYANSNDEIFIIGGGTIYNSLLPYTKKLYITHVDKYADGDTSFPIIEKKEFELEEKSEVMFSTTEQCDFYFANYIRK